MIVCLILLSIFEDSINRFTGFSYIDELIVFGLFVLICLRGKIEIIRKDKNILLVCLLFYVVGVLSAIVNGYQYSINHSILSGIFSIKAFLVYIGVKTYLNSYSPSKLTRKIAIWGKMSEFLLICTSSILVVDNFTNFFTINEYRLGIHISRFVFSHPTGLACFGVALTLCALYYRFSSGIDNKYYCNLLPCAIILAISGRTKAIAFFVFLCVILLFESRNERALKLRKIVFLIPVVVVVGWRQIVFYFLSDFETSRGALYGTSIAIANDHFPFGAGFATYGTEFSRVFYSPLYSKYGISHIWGLSQSYSAFIADAMWPAVIGETGYIGLVLVGIVLYMLLKQILDIKINKKTEIIILSLFIYFLIESIGDTIFMSPRGVCIMLIFALFMSDSRNAQIDIK